MAGPNTATFDESNFESQVLASPSLVLVDFSAEWCGPCQLLGPTIDELATEYAGKVRVGKVDIDRAAQIAQRFDVLNIPTVILFERGQPVERLVGAKRKSEYQNLLNKRLNG